MKRNEEGFYENDGDGCAVVKGDGGKRAGNSSCHFMHAANELRPAPDEQHVVQPDVDTEWEYHGGEGRQHVLQRGRWVAGRKWCGGHELRVGGDGRGWEQRAGVDGVGAGSDAADQCESVRHLLCVA